MPDTITIGELRDLIKHEKIRPDQLFSKEDFQNCKPLIKAMADKEQLEDYRNADRKLKKDKLKEDDMIPGDDKPILSEEQKRQQEKNNRFVPDNEPESDDDDLIPD